MSVVQTPFNKRLRKIFRDYQRMSQGATHVMRADGLVVAQPRLYNLRFPLRGILLIVGAANFFKAFILATLGNFVYSEKIATFAEGSAVERLGDAARFYYC
ncbi:hypothetical protein [Cognatiyoonia sp.]|uniref:hypothetical protein n=1 Tax=Cognatiyoonia sp. TaxID=2211652 RepID=UPI003F69B6EC